MYHNILNLKISSSISIRKEQINWKVPFLDQVSGRTATFLKDGRLNDQWKSSRDRQIVSLRNMNSSYYGCWNLKMNHQIYLQISSWIILLVSYRFYKMHQPFPDFYAFILFWNDSILKNKKRNFRIVWSSECKHLHSKQSILYSNSEIKTIWHFTFNYSILLYSLEDFKLL